MLPARNVGMAGTDPLYLDPPSEEDLAVALSAWRDGRIRTQVEVEARWYRILRAPSGDEALEYARVCYPSDANNRFSPIQRSGAIVPAAYAGDQPEIAAWEVVLRDIRHMGIRRVPEHQTRDRYLVEVRLARPLSVLNIRRPEMENLVVAGKHSPSLSAAPAHLYDRTRAWAQRLFEQIPGMEGILYESHQIPGDCIIVLSDAGSPVFEPSGRATRMADEPVCSLLRREAARVNAVVDFGEQPDSTDG
jgi:hypothetical protein